MAAILTRTKEGVLSVFDVQGQPIFAIYEGSKPLTCCSDPSPKKRREALAQYLQFMQDGDTDGNFELRCYDQANKNGKVTNADPFFASLPFKVNESLKQAELRQTKNDPAASATGSMQFMNQLFDAKLQVLDLKYQHLLEKKDDEILKLQQELIDDDSDDGYEDDRVGQILGTIGAVGEKHPWMQDLLKNFGNTVNNMLRGANTKWTSMTETPMAVNGVDAPPKPAKDKTLDDQLKWANLTLVKCYRAKHGIKTDADGKITEGTQEQLEAADTEYVHDMVKLAEVASTKPKTFNNAIEALREL